jgi:hypothetical protein
MIGPLDDLVTRIHRRIDGFKVDHGLDKVTVSIELLDGALHKLVSISPEPGYGFVTLCPQPEDGEPAELIVPLGAIREIRISGEDDEQRLGFSLPAEPD